MHLRRIACLLLGAWLAGTIAVGWIATANFDAADSVQASPPLEIQKVTSSAGANQVHMVLRYLVAVENADYFMTWELVEFGILGVLIAVLFTERQTRKLVAIPAVLFVLVAFQHFRVTREIIWLGQAMVLAGGGASTQMRDQFGTMHRMYGVVEVLKLVLALVLAVWLISKKTTRRLRRASLDQLEATTRRDRRYAN